MAFQLPKRTKKDTGKPAKSRAFTATKGSKFVLFLGDEGAILVYIKGHVVQSRQFVPDASQQNLREFGQTLHKDIKAPLMLVVDNMDQSFMQQTLPPVSSLSVNRLIKRRLERDFGSSDIKGALLLGREKTGRKDWNFLMVALEKSPQLTLWLDFLADIPNRFMGVYLASVEAEILVRQLEHSIGVSDEGEAEWKFFVSHNKVGGFRQVILRNNRIVFTRLAQPIGESTPEVIAGNIEQEMLSTIEYMKRLSFTPQSKLEITIVTSSAIKAAIDSHKFNTPLFKIFTPYEVAQYLGIEGAAQPTDQFGDVVMAATIGCSKKHILPMGTPQSKRIEQIYQIILYQRLGAVLAVLAIIGYAIYSGYNIYELSEETDTIQRQKSTIENGLQALRDEIKSNNLDVEKASDLVDLYKQLMKEKLSPLPILRNFEPLTKAPVWIKTFDWDLVTETRIIRPTFDPTQNAPQDPSQMMATRKKVDLAVMTVTLEFPGEATDPNVFRLLSKKILGDFREQFKDYEVNYASLPEEIAENDRLEIRSGQQVEINADALEVKLLIKGDLDMIMALSAAKKIPKQATSTPAIPQPPVMPTPSQ